MRMVSFGLLWRKQLPMALALLLFLRHTNTTSQWATITTLIIVLTRAANMFREKEKEKNKYRHIVDKYHFFSSSTAAAAAALVAFAALALTAIYGRSKSDENGTFNANEPTSAMSKCGFFFYFDRCRLNRRLELLKPFKPVILLDWPCNWLASCWNMP